MLGGIEMIWHTIYIYCHETVKQEELMVKLKRILDKSKEKWFFIKYWHGGPHVRLRFQEQDEQFRVELEEEIKNFFKNNKVNNVDRDVFYSFNNFDGEDVDPDTLPWYESGDYFYTEYIPEIRRYGEGNILEMNESIFHASSLLALKVFEKALSYNSRIVLAAYIIKRILSETISLDMDFLDQYQAYWKSMAGKLKKENTQALQKIMHMVMEEQLPFSFLEENIDMLIDNMIILKQELAMDEFKYVLSSQIHMMNNRISVTPELEYVISKNMREYIYEKMEACR